MNTQLKVGTLTGGIKENKPQHELSIGDLIKGHNYNEVDGIYHGYRSMSGYEVFDGTQKPSSVGITITDSDGVTTYEDSAREARRAAISSVGGSNGSGKVLGCFNRGSDVIAVRNTSAGTSSKLWRSSSSSWVEVPLKTIYSYSSGNKNTGTKIKIGDSVSGSGFTAKITGINTESGSWDSGTGVGFFTVDVLTGSMTSGSITNTSGATATYTSSSEVLIKDGDYKFSKCKFDLFTDLQRKDVVFSTSGKYFPSYIKDNTLVPLLNHDLPDNKSLGSFAICSVEFKNRLWLGYSDGRLVFSNVGNPLDFDPTTFSGLISIEDEIVDLAVTTGDVLVVFCKNSVQLVKALSVGDTVTQVTTDYLFSTSSLTTTSGCLSNTVQRVFDDLLYIDDRGLTSLEATQKYGDFETKSYSKNIQKTLTTNFSNIIGVHVDKLLNQYRVFLSDGFGLIFTFSMSSSKYSSSSYKTIKGITTFRYLVGVSCVCDRFFGSTDGYLYEFDSGTSYNGNPIDTLLSTSYFHYNSPSIIKRFKEVYLEGSIPYKLAFSVKADFDYRNVDYIRSTTQGDLVISGGMGANYDSGVYGESRYGESENQTSVYYVSAYGTNMSLSVRTSSKYIEPHVLSSMVVHYSLNGRRM